MKRKFALLFLTTLLVVSLAKAPVTLAAQEAAQTDDWQFSVELYGLGASIGGQSATGSDIDINLDDILDSLEFAFMGMLGARKGKWLFAADVVYFDAASSAAIAPGLNASVDLNNWIITPVVGYNLVDTGKGRLDILGGARYLYMKTDLRLDALGAHAEDSRSNWDGVIGARGDVDLTEKLYLFGYLDIGTGDSDLTWQALAGIGYRFKWFDINATYNYLEWDFDDNAALDKLNISGPALGIKFVF